MADLEVLENRTTIWGGNNGLAFALNIGRQRRHDLARFVVQHAHKLPVRVTIVKKHRRRTSNIIPVNVGDSRKLIFAYKRFLIVMNFADVLHIIQSRVGDRSLSYEDLLHLTRDEAQNLF